jgi:predicted dehydrogenase
VNRAHSAGDTGPVRVGVAGLGRSGWNIHVRTIQALPEQFRVVAVADADASRRRQAEEALGCRSYADPAGLIADDEVELLVVSTFNRQHTEHAVAGLEAGRHVLGEKPFALTVADLDRTLAAAARAGRLVVPFQNRRYEALFQKVLEVVRSGILGEILLVRIAWQSFGRRWDWQTTLDRGAGALANNGPHLLDHAAHFVGEGEMEIYSDLRNGLSSGDGEDHAKIVIKTPTGPTVDLELTSCAAYALDRWQIMGTAGGLRGTGSELHWRWVDWGAAPPRPLDPRPTPDRSYNREALDWHEESWTADARGDVDNQAFYRDLYATLRQGRPLVVTPESVRRPVTILEHCRAAYTPSPPRYAGAARAAGAGVP